MSPAGAAAVAALRAAGATVAVAESLTGGRLADAFVSVPGASAVFRGGLVAYATDLKTGLLDVPAGLLADRGPVDPDVARAMAAGARARCAADWAVATTGVAGPLAQGDRPVGLVHIAVAGPDGATHRTCRFEGDRDAIRNAAVDAALVLFLSRLSAPAA
ncbi:competence damage-inducible protein A [Pilimelia terevasa]|uniref:Competence damage-inducible protein A n=1 Tax=Pilimelia terevasa TaxID=53372 RepID=A0A8J3BLB9_9ACTN|nr:CinA family protein [Pilimelia terevasa]GGK27578.1 competence damage-inducible protein A [Pilimelia terevasa]